MRLSIFVYSELLGTRVVIGVRQSEVQTYTGRALCGGGCAPHVHARHLYRGRKDEVSLRVSAAAKKRRAVCLAPPRLVG